MWLRSQVAGFRRRALLALVRRDVVIRSDRPLISFSFDDFPRTALTAGGSILKNAGVRGTYYVASALIDTVNNLGAHFQKEDLFELLADGHELASHTYSHVSARSTSHVNYGREIEKGYRALTETFGLNASRHFAYPYGDITLRVKGAVAPTMQSSRGIYPGLNGPRTDLNLLRANSLYGDVEQLAPNKALIEKNRRNKYWLIFYTHDVRPNPSPYGCTPALFEQVVQAAVESGARIATVHEVVSLAESV